MKALRSFNSQNIPLPLDLDFSVCAHALSSNSRIFLEIGCGVGWHPIQLAMEYPEVLVIGVEHSKSRFAAFQRRVEAHRMRDPKALANLLPVHADAESFVVHALKEQSLERVYMMYPNPYPKASQANKRWMQAPFMECLLEKLKPKAVFEMRTNEAWYAKESVKQAKALWNLKQVDRFRVQKNTHPNFQVKTHFEKKYFERGQVLHVLRWNP